MRSRKGLGAAALGLVMLVSAAAGGQAAAQTVTAHTTFVIHPYDAPKGELVAMPGEPLLRQAVTSTRAARFDEEAPSMLGMGQVKAFPAGTEMFGVQVPDGWIYCAVSKKENRFWFSDEFACYQDTDSDGRFDHVRPSGAPFQGIPLFVLQPGAPKPLPAPVRYSAMPYQDGPQVEIGIAWKVVGVPPSSSAGVARPKPSEVRINTNLIHGKTAVPIYAEKKADIDGGRISRDGAEIVLLGLNEDGGLRYRIERTMPAQVAPITLQLTTSTYWYVVSY